MEMCGTCGGIIFWKFLVMQQIESSNKNMVKIQLIRQFFVANDIAGVA
jgi:hypothetical protein